MVLRYGVETELVLLQINRKRLHQQMPQKNCRGTPIHSSSCVPDLAPTSFSPCGPVTPPPSARLLPCSSPIAAAYKLNGQSVASRWLMGGLAHRSRQHPARCLLVQPEVGIRRQVLERPQRHVEIRLPTRVTQSGACQTWPISKASKSPLPPSPPIPTWSCIKWQ